MTPDLFRRIFGVGYLNGPQSVLIGSLMGLLGILFYFNIIFDQIGIGGDRNGRRSLFFMAALTSTGPVQLQGVGGVHTADAVEDAKHRT